MDAIVIVPSTSVQKPVSIPVEPKKDKATLLREY
jgi:hypothetical protein